jgi:hypothetical protein
MKDDDDIVPAISTLHDEFCSNDIYFDNVVSDETLVEEILVTPDCQDGWKDDDVKNLLDYNFKILGVNMVKIEMNRSDKGALTSCLVKILPIPLKKVEKLSLHLRNWSLKTVS